MAENVLGDIFKKRNDDVKKINDETAEEMNKLLSGKKIFIKYANTRARPSEREGKVRKVSDWSAFSGKIQVKITFENGNYCYVEQEDSIKIIS